MQDYPVLRTFLWTLLCIMVNLSAVPAPTEAMTRAEAVQALMAKLHQADAPGEALFSEDFEDGKLEGWWHDPGWKITDRPEGQGKCAQVISSTKDYEDLALNEHIPVAPGHPIAVCWKTRFVSGSTPLWLRVDFFNQKGAQCDPYAHQDKSRESGEWTDNAILVSDWFPPATRAITVWFHHGPNARTTSLLDDVRVVDLGPAVQKLLSQELADLVKQGTRLLAESQSLPPSSVNDAWKATIKAHSASLRAELAAASRLDLGGAERERAIERPALYVRRFADAVPGLRQKQVTNAKVLVYSVSPITSTMILPYTQNLPGELTSGVEIAACPGEYEPLSLALWAPDDVASCLLKVTDLTCPGGVISAANIEIKWVKCWYQAGTAWWGVPQDRSRKVLVPELLLNDDSLVQVDLERRHDELKMAYPDGPKYVPVDDPTPITWGHQYSLEEYPVQDSQVLLPTNLPAGQNKQVWITVKVPPQTAPGRYTGQITLLAGKQEIGKLPLIVQVLPFRLAAPKTHYDCTKEFTYSLYYWGELDPKGLGKIGFKHKNAKQFKAELQYLWEHNIVAPVMIWSAQTVYENEPLFRRHLNVAREVGMAGRPLYFGSSDMIGNPTKPDDLVALQARVRRTVNLAREYGFTAVYFYGLDEARGDRLLSQRTAWEKVHEAGGKVIVSGYAGHLEAVGDLLDLLNWSGDPTRARPAEWHRLGHQVWNYAHPQTPPENPELYRRNYGLLLWKCDFDGACTYCFIDAAWNDFAYNDYRAHNIAYPTVDGVVGTLAMEGMREGADDVKYATTLRLAIERAQKEGTPEAKAAAARAAEWLERIDPHQCDLELARQTLIQQILAVRGLVE